MPLDTLGFADRHTDMPLMLVYCTIARFLTGASAKVR